MSNNQSNNNELTVKYEIEGQEIRLTPSIVQQYIVGTDVKITMQEFKLFTELCKVRKLNPFLREAYLIKYTPSQPAQIVVGKDAILKRAVLNSQYNGMKSGIIVEKENGTIEERKGLFYLANKERVVGGWAEVYRKDWENPIYCSVALDEVAQKTKDGNLNSNWSNKTATMIEKVAKVRALRETFVEDLAGMYDADEVTNSVSENIKNPEVIIEQTDDVPDAVVIDAEVKQEELSFNDLS